MTAKLLKPMKAGAKAGTIAAVIARPPAAAEMIAKGIGAPPGAMLCGLTPEEVREF